MKTSTAYTRTANFLRFCGIHLETTSFSRCKQCGVRKVRKGSIANDTGQAKGNVGLGLGRCMLTFSAGDQTGVGLCMLTCSQTCDSFDEMTRSTQHAQSDACLPYELSNVRRGV